MSPWFSGTFQKVCCKLSQELGETALSSSLLNHSNLYPSTLLTARLWGPVLVRLLLRVLPTVFSECLTAQCLWLQWRFHQHCLTVLCWRYELASRPAGNFSLLSLNKTWAGPAFPVDPLLLMDREAMYDEARHSLDQLSGRNL